MLILSNEFLSPIDIHIGGDYVFRQTCQNGHTEIAKWLCLLCNEYKIIIDSNDKITYYILY
jgi:hypothetical protein